MFRDDRKISWENFEAYYLNHGVMNYLSQSIIWNFHKPAEKVSAIFVNNYWVNSNNEIVDMQGTDTVSLWHPVQVSVNEIKT